MENEYYYLNELELLMEKFITDQTKTGPEFGWLPPLINRRMAEAAYAVLVNTKELNDFLEKEGQLKQ
jgi:hypothetical protein